MRIFTPFSRRHQKAIGEKKIIVSIPRRVRGRLWQLLQSYNFGYRVTNDQGWNSDTSMLEELPGAVMLAHGVKQLEAFVDDGSKRQKVDLEGFVMGAYPGQVLDVFELACRELPDEKCFEFQSDVNEIMVAEHCPWTFCDGLFFKLDTQFIEQHVLSKAHGLLRQAGFEGALQEFLEARKDLDAHDYKSAIQNAEKALESTLKVITNRPKDTAKALLGALSRTPEFALLPREVKTGFTDAVLQGVPFIRNRLAGHGQGKEVVAVPAPLAELTVHMAAAQIIFLIKLHIEAKGAKPKPSSNASADIDEVPF